MVDSRLTPAPYVALPNNDSKKKSKDSPSQDLSRWFLMICGILALFNGQIEGEL